MLKPQSIQAADLQGLSRKELNELIPQLLARIDEQAAHIGTQDQRLGAAQQDIKWRDARIEKITFQLAQLRSWKFGAKSERMSAEQRELFAETLAADQASLEAQLAALQQTPGSTPEPGKLAPKRRPTRVRQFSAGEGSLGQWNQRLESRILRNL